MRLISFGTVRNRGEKSETQEEGKRRESKNIGKEKGKEKGRERYR